MKVLLAEDDHNISTIAKMALEQLGGHSVDLAHDGAKALELAINNSYDVILLDEMMPKINGLKVCQEYVEQRGKSTPVIFLSAKSQESDLKEFEANGLGLIPKPFDPTQLCSLIEKLLDDKGYSSQ